MLTSFLRSGLMVKLETPMSYLPPVTPRMIVPKPAGTYSVLRPSLAATASKRETSHPSTVLPSEASISFVAYVGSVPTTILPADFSVAGTFAARAWSTPPPAEVAPAWLPPASVVGDREFEPQADRLRPTATTPVAAMRDMRRMKGPSERAGACWAIWRAGATSRLLMRRSFH